jgi:hypothetical protein
MVLSWRKTKKTIKEIMMASGCKKAIRLEAFIFSFPIKMVEFTEAIACIEAKMQM